ncbi:PWWP domain-containing protein [Psidium guajava]|nr:PWWP domain-containing protein [Psidium guajava]
MVDRGSGYRELKAMRAKRGDKNRQPDVVGHKRNKENQTEAGPWGLRHRQPARRATGCCAGWLGAGGAVCEGTEDRQRDWRKVEQGRGLGEIFGV